MIINAGIIALDPGDVEAFIHDAQANVRPIALSMPGCSAFHIVAEDLARGTALAFEVWQDQAALDALLARPEVKQHFSKWQDRMEVRVRKFDASNERGAFEA